MQQPNGQEPDHRYTPRQQKTEKVNLRRACFFLAGVFALLLIYGGTQLFLKQRDTERTEAINRENRSLLGTDGPSVSPNPSAAPDLSPVPGRTDSPESAGTPEPTPPPSVRRVKGSASPRPPVQGKFDDLIATNEDTVGWLKTEAVYRIDFAVVQRDNEYYMDHDFSKASNREGAAFLDESNSLWPRDDHLIIFAHNMKSGSMFGELNSLSSYDAISRNPFTVFDTLYENGVYIPFAVVNCDVSDPHSETYFNFYQLNFRTTGSFDSFVDRAKALSLVDLRRVDVRTDDPLLTLSTCYDDANKTRFLVMLRKLRPDETRASVLADYFPPADSVTE